MGLGKTHCFMSLITLCRSLSTTKEVVDAILHVEIWLAIHPATLAVTQSLSKPSMSSAAVPSSSSMLSRLVR